MSGLYDADGVDLAEPPLYSKHPLVGKRVELVRCTDQYTRLAPGEEGTVTFVDALRRSSSGSHCRRRPRC